MTISNTRRNFISVDLTSLESLIDWSKEKRGTFVKSVHGVPVYSGSSTDIMSTEGFYVDREDLAEAVFEDTYTGNVILKELGLYLDLSSGKASALLDFINKWGTPRSLLLVDEVSTTIKNAINFGLLTEKSVNADGELYIVHGHYVLKERGKLYLVDGDVHTEF